ncbi:MAG: AAA family ATPase, partial [Pyrinomonadaceae bacterium]
NILLQVMDHATLTDNNGKRADFRHVVLIMTTNAGAREISAMSIGFGSGTDETSVVAAKSRDAIEKTFSPEFRNRLDAWVAFAPLGFAVIERVVDKFINELRVDLTDKNVTLELTEAARAWLAINGFDRKNGARPMARLIQSCLREPLADKLLFGELQNGGQVVIDVVGNEIVISVGSLTVREGQGKPALTLEPPDTSFA